MPTWWEERPGLLAEELEALERAGIPFVVDEAARASGILRLELEMTIRGEHLDLVAVYPDVYPFTKPEVYAHDLALPRHQNPGQKNLCLLGRASENWETDRTLADHLTDQLPKLLDAARRPEGTPSPVPEEPQGEPLTDYYRGTPGAMILLDTAMSVPPEVNRGTLTLRLDRHPVTNLIGDSRRGYDGPVVRGVLARIRADGTVLDAPEPLRAAIVDGVEISGRWVRLDPPPPPPANGDLAAFSRELASRLGSGTNWRSMTNQLYGDPRFKRTGVRNIGLAEWEHDEYTGVADEIAQEIERQGGEAQLDHLIAHVSTTYGASEASVRAYASGPRFERSDTGSIRLRTASRPRIGARPLEMTRGAFLVDGRWGFRVRVNDQHMRGSGTVISEGISGIFGLEPLGASELGSEFGGVRLAWPTLSPHIGTIRPALESLGADEGDIVFLVPEGDRVTFRHVPRSMLEALEGLERLAAEVGAGGSRASPLESAVRALGLADSSTAMTVARRPRARGEDELAALAVTTEEDEPLVLTLGAARFVEVRISG